MADGHTQSTSTSFDLSTLLHPKSPATPMQAVAAMIDALGLPTDPDLDRYIAAEIVRQRNVYGAGAAERARASGVHFGGMEPDARQPRGFDEVLESAVAAKRRREDWSASPEGRFHAAALLIARATGDERLLNCAVRGVTHEIERASRLLAEMEGPAADAARAALADMTSAA